MFEISINEFFGICSAEFVNLDKDLAGKKISISTDSRSLQAGSVFWALPGERFDGHNYIADALQKKALFCVLQKNKLAQSQIDFPAILVPDSLKALQELAQIHRKKFDIPLLSITGSNGKTTTKEMIAHILSGKLRLHKTSGNLNNHIGCPLTLLQLNASHQAAVIELGSNHPGEIGLLTRIVLPTQALITNIGGAHLEFFANEQALASEKLDLFREMPDKGTIYRNLDNPYLNAYQNKAQEIISYSLHRKADVQGKISGVDAAGNASWRLNDKTDIQLHIAGMHNVQNALAASAVALKFGLSAAEIKDLLETYRAVEKRMQTLNLLGATFINDAYNANPLSMQAAFETLKLIKRRNRLFLILGDMLELGKESLNWHQKILHLALKLKPQAVFVLGENMEKSRQLPGNRNLRKIAYFKNHRELAAELKSQLKEGDLVLLKGSRSMQMEKVLDYLQN